MEPSELIALSPAGAARREAILQDIRAALASRRRRRTAVRAAAVIAPVVIATTLIARVHAPAKILAPNPGPIVTAHAAPVTTLAPAPATAEHSPAQRPVLAMRHAAFEEVESRPDLPTQWAVQGDPHRFAALTDDQVLHELQEAGRPTGLIRTASHVEFTTQVARIPGDAPPGG